jgi:putative pyruvate formate lyase activating enzyme
MFLELKAQGCHNVNCVTPTHFLPQLLTALKIAAGEGFDLPIVYNTSGYESLGALALVDGCVDIYLADMRYSSGESAARCSGARDYPAVNRAAVKEMWRQGGAVAIDKAGVARRGLIVRHLVLPGRLAGTRESFRFLAGEVSRTVSVSLMNQYTPCHAAIADPLLGRRITREEYDEATACLDECGLEFGWVQEWSEDADDECFLGTSLTANV